MDIRSRYVDILMRRKGIIILSLIIFLSISVIGVLTIKPVYKSSAKIKINPSDFSPKFIENFPTNLGIGSLSYLDERNVMDTLRELTLTDSVLNKVIKKLELKDKKGKYLEAIDFVVKTTSIPRLILSQKKGIRLNQILNTEMIQITGYSDDPKEAENIANTTANLMVQLYNDVIKSQIINIYTLLNKKVQDKKMELENSRDTLQNLKIVEKIPDLKEQISSLRSKIYDYKKELETVERSLDESKTTLLKTINVLNKQPEYYKSSTTIRVNPMISSFKTEMLSVLLDIEKNKQDFTPEAVEMKVLQSKYNLLEEQLKNAIEKEYSGDTIERNSYYNDLVKNIGTTEIQIVGYLSKKEIFKNQINQIQKEVNELLLKNNKLTQLEDTVASLKEEYNSLLKSLKSTEIAKDLSVQNLSIVQPALLSKINSYNKFFPKKITIVVSFWASLLFSVFVITFLEWIDDTIRTTEEIKDVTDLPLLGSISKTPITTDLISADSETLNTFWNIENKISIQNSSEFPKVILITSATEKENKSITSIYLAYIYAQKNIKTLLMDANLKNPTLHNFFHIHENIGLSDIISKKIDLVNSIKDTTISGLSLIPAGIKKEIPLKILDKPTLENIIEELKIKFDRIIIDTPSIRSGSEALLFSSFADAIIFVIKSSKANRSVIKESLDILRHTKSKILGVVFNTDKKS